MLITIAAFAQAEGALHFDAIGIILILFSGTFAVSSWQLKTITFGLDLVCVFETEEQVRNMNPNQNLLTSIPGRIQNATAKG